MDVCETTRILSVKRKRIAWLWLLLLLGVFWSLSRYPDLMKEYNRAKADTLIERDAGNLSKDEMIKSEESSSNLSVAGTTALNWYETNKYGMSFGIFFAAAILFLFEQTKTLYRYAGRRGMVGIITGLFLGMPLGVCTNCATPVSLGMAKAGASLEAAFATLIASPSLNPIGLTIILLVLPIQLGIIRIVTMLGFILILLPLLTRLLLSDEARALAGGAAGIPTQVIEETWPAALKGSARSYGKHLGYILRKVLPPMILVGLIAALFVAYYPIQNLALVELDTPKNIVIAGVVGALLPMPMFVDIIIVVMLLELGVPVSLAATLIVTLAPTSLYAAYVMGRNVSWRLSLSVMALFACIGIAIGMGVRTQSWQLDPVDVTVAKNRINQGSNFEVIFQKRLPQNFNNRSLANFFAGGVSLIDVDNDQDLDIFFPANRNSTLLINDGKGHFTDATSGSGIDTSYNTVAGIFGDYDNDGLPDLLQVNYRGEDGKPQANRLYKNLGHGVFKDVTEAVGGLGKDHSSSAAWGDFDNDGDLDLFVSNYGKIDLVDTETIEGESEHDRLYRNDNGKFTDVTEIAGVAGKALKTHTLRNIELDEVAGDRGFSFQPVWFDFDGDNRLDLFVTSDFGTSQLYHNLGDGRFENVTVTANMARFGTGMGVEVFDFNRDGKMDLYVTTTTRNQLWLNRGDGTFQESAEHFGVDDKSRTGWGIGLLDIANRNSQTLFVSNGPILEGRERSTVYQKTLDKLFSRNTVLVQSSREHFIEASRETGLFNLNNSRGAAVGDIDGDGLQDLVISNRDAPHLMVFKNKGEAPGHYLSLRFLGRKSNRQGVGVRVTLVIHGQPYVKVLQAGSSFQSQHGARVHFGLGEANKVDSLTVEWPSGRRQVLKDVDVDRLLLIEEPNS